MKLNGQTPAPSKHALAVMKTIAKRVDEELSLNPMASDGVLCAIIDDAVESKIYIVQVVGRKDGNKENVLRELKATSVTLKRDMRNRFMKKGAAVVDLTVTEADR